MTSTTISRNYLSIGSLALLSAISLNTILQLHSTIPSWALWPTYFIFLGSFGGFLWELLNQSTSKQINNIVTSFRSSNLPIVASLNLFLYERLFTTHDPSIVFYFVVSIAVFSWWTTILGQHKILSFASTTSVNIALVVISFNVEGGFYFFISNFISTIGLYIPMAFPNYFSFVFHIIASIANVFMFFGLKTTTFPLDDISYNSTYIFLASVVGFALVMLFPLQRNELRYRFVSTVWNILMGFLLITPINLPPPPPSPQDGYKDEISWVPYFVNNPRSAPFIVPSASFIPLSQRYNYHLLIHSFRVMSILDCVIPMSNERVSLSDKPRIGFNESSSDYWPLAFDWTGSKIPSKETEQIIKPFEEGRVLEWLANRNTQFERYLRKANKLEIERCPDVTHVLDLTFLEEYEPKKEYCHYGGKAYFKVNEVKDKRYLFELLYVVEPLDKTERLISVKSQNPLFALVSKQIHASLTFINVVLCHLLEIHTMCNTVSVSLYNAFDVNCKKVHGFRAVLQVHFSHHTEVQEITTSHLMNIRGVFEQVFAYPHDVLIKLINEEFKLYEFAYDCDFQRRRDLLGDLTWEEDYIKIFFDYGAEVVDHIWKDDEDVEKDPEMKKFYQNLNSVLPNGVPKRYGQLSTKKQVAHFIADSIYVVTVRHEVYGTTNALYFLDNRYSSLGQITKDGLPHSKEAYLSLIQITAATALKAFPKLLPNPAVTKKDYAITPEHYQFMLKEVQPALRQHLVDAFKRFQERLINLDREWKSRGDWAFAESVSMPSELEIGAGY